jgi:malate/lactate dehydrogenase
MGHPHRVAIVGAGHVGATTAYALLLSGLAPEIVLIDLDAQRAQGEAMDLMHAVPFSDPVRVWAGGYEDVEIIERKGATYYAVAAGVVRIIQAILRDESTVLTVSSRLTGSYGLEDVCLSLPCIVNRSGIAQLLDPPLAAEELSALRHSADVLKAAQRSLV